MARQTFDNGWIPVEYSADAIVRPQAQSVVEAVAKHLPMNTASKVVPRSGASAIAVVSKGSAYGEDGATNDSIQLNAVKIAEAYRIANEDLDDSLANIIQLKQDEFTLAYAKFLDNACLGTTAAANLTTVPFTSVYRAVTTADAGAGYTANTNYFTSAGAVTYAKLSSLFGLLEAGEFWDSSRQVVIAHPSAIGTLRAMLDSQGRPIFDSTGGPQGSLFGCPLRITSGAKTSATASRAPAGNPLIMVVNPDYLLLGDRSGVEAKLSDQVGFLTDEKLLGLRARKAFGLGNPFAAAVLEVTAT